MNRATRWMRWLVFCLAAGAVLPLSLCIGGPGGFFITDLGFGDDDGFFDGGWFDDDDDGGWFGHDDDDWEDVLKDIFD